MIYWLAGVRCGEPWLAGVRCGESWLAGVRWGESWLADSGVVNIWSFRLRWKSLQSIVVSCNVEFVLVSLCSGLYLFLILLQN